LGRVVDQNWSKSDGVIVDRFQYGYDRGSNRLWRQVGQSSPFATTPPGKDEFYSYAGLNRLTHTDRGTLTGGPPPTGVTNATFKQDWTQLESLGNWRQFKQDSTGGGTYDLDQARTHSPANEISGIT
jgi:hypothetical protein